MKVRRLRSLTRVAAPLDEVWAFFSDPTNLALITPPWLGLRITGDPPACTYPGLIITYDVRVFPALRVGWVTEITHVDAPRFFVDEQRAGPYRFWHHQHHFAPIDGGTEVRDVVHYALPFGLLGDFAGAGAVARRLRNIFAYRNRVVRDRFGPPVAPRP